MNETAQQTKCSILSALYLVHHQSGALAFERERHCLGKIRRMEIWGTGSLG